jgi:hypothetical protein
MPSKNNFFLRIFLLIPYYILGTFTSVFIDKLFISHKKQMKSRFFSIFWLLNGRNRIRTNNYVSGSCSLRPNNLQILRIWLRARIRNTGTNIEFRIRSCSHCPFQSRDIIYKIPSYVQVPIVAGTENTSATYFQSATEPVVCYADSRTNVWRHFQTWRLLWHMSKNTEVCKVLVNLYLIFFPKQIEYLSTRPIGWWSQQLVRNKVTTLKVPVRFH